uniref:Synaptonemal complex central element protein 2 n=2 Tax=Anolis carolinensis TaxID=28377 RepID=G1KHL2_ANOCA|nr:PREDICTED: synaptonemal complex central element protein 2 isoform X1 [Anolis carolinensis]|eukprot:XP_008101290.1 PREDICTED: synaptonemal complex central element protein 2 isoform X1 [Anolis carolinensis]
MQDMEYKEKSHGRNEAAMSSNQEFLFEEAEQNKSNSPFFSNVQRSTLSDDLLRKESPNLRLSSPLTSGGSDSRSTSFFMALNSTIENMEQRTQQLIDKINGNRKNDHEFMNTFRENLLMKVSSLAEKLEERVFYVYDHNSKLIQDKLQVFSEIMERIRQIETELRQVCNTVEILYKDLCGQAEL